MCVCVCVCVFTQYGQSKYYEDFLSSKILSTFKNSFRTESQPSDWAISRKIFFLENVQMFFVALGKRQISYDSSSAVTVLPTNLSGKNKKRRKISTDFSKKHYIDFIKSIYEKGSFL